MSTTTQINTMGIQPSVPAQNDGIGGQMYITELDQGTKRLKVFSDKIKRTKDISEAELENFMNQLHSTIIEGNSLGDDNKQALRNYIYDDLCDGVILELCNTKGLSRNDKYQRFRNVDEEDTELYEQKKLEEEKYVEKVIKVLVVFLDIVHHELKHQRYNENLLRACTWVFDPRTEIHKHFYQLKQEHLDRYKNKTSQQKEWRRKLKEGDNVDVRVKLDLDQEESTSKGWIRGRINKVTANLYDIDNLTPEIKEKIIKADREKNPQAELITDMARLRRFCGLYPQDIEQFGAEDVFNELTIVFPELPSYRDVLIDRWSNDLAQNGTQTEKEYSWKKAFEYSTIAFDDYDDEMDSKVFQEVKIRSKEVWYDGTIVSVYQNLEEEDPIVKAEKERQKQLAEEEKKEQRGGGSREEDKKQEEKIEKKNPTRSITYVTVGFRIYCRNGVTSNRKDDNGNFFHGFGQNQDKCLPLYDPRIRAADLTRLQKYHEDLQVNQSAQNESDPDEVDGHYERWAENMLLDELIPFAQPKWHAGYQKLQDCPIKKMGKYCCYCIAIGDTQYCTKHKSKYQTEPCECKNYCFPREQVSISTKFVEMMNYFGNIGGFQLIQDALSERVNKIKHNNIREVMFQDPAYLFHEDIVNHLTSQSQRLNINKEEKLRLYGLYKQSAFGDFNNQNEGLRQDKNKMATALKQPDIEESDLLKAWNSNEGKSSEELKEAYVEKMKRYKKDIEKINEDKQMVIQQPPSLTAICQLTMMVSMPFQLLHFDFVLGTDGEVEEDMGDDDEAWMFFSPSSYPSDRAKKHANSYWKIDGKQLHTHELDSYIDLEEDSWMFFNPSAIPSKETYLNSQCNVQNSDREPVERSAFDDVVQLQGQDKRLFGRTHAGYGVSYTQYVTKQLIEADEASLKALQTVDIGSMQFSLSQVFYAIYSKQEADTMAQMLKLDICQKCLGAKSVTLDLKLWCINELTELVKMRIEQSQDQPGQTQEKERKQALQKLVKDMNDSRAFELIWGKKNATDKIIDQSADIFKKLAQHQVLDHELMKMFWLLITDSDLRTNVFTILTDTKNLEEQHLKYIVDEIFQIRNQDISRMKKNDKDNNQAQQEVVDNKQYENVQLSELQLKLLSCNESFRRSEHQKERVVDFFWSVLNDSALYKTKLVLDAIKNFNDFYLNEISHYEILQLLKKFVEDLKTDQGDTPTASYTKLFVQLFQKIQVNQKIKAPDKSQQEDYNLKTNEDAFVKNRQNIEDELTKARKKKIDELIKQKMKDKDEIIRNHKRYVDSLTLKDVVSYVMKDLHLKDLIKQNLIDFKQKAKIKYSELSDSQKQNYSYEKDTLLSNFSQYEQIMQRANFLTELQKRVGEQFEQEDIQHVFEVCNTSLNDTDIVKDKITDMKVFFEWCSEATVVQNLINQQYNPEEKNNTQVLNYCSIESTVAMQFINQKIEQKVMLLKDLPKVGYEFIEKQFMEINQKQIYLPIDPGTKKKNKMNRHRPQQPDDHKFKVWKEPDQLSHIEIMREIAYQGEDPDIIDRALGLYINCYLAIADHEDKSRYNSDLQKEVTRKRKAWEREQDPEKKPIRHLELKQAEEKEEQNNATQQQVNEYTSLLIKKIFDQISSLNKNDADDLNKIQRMILILSRIILISEKRGCKVKPHKAVLKGDMIQQIVVEYHIQDVQDHTRTNVYHELEVEARTTTTVWEFVDQVARLLGLGYFHIKISLQDSRGEWKPIRDSDYGKILQEIGLKANSIIRAERLPTAERVTRKTAEELCTWRQSKKNMGMGSNLRDMREFKQYDSIPKDPKDVTKAIAQNLFHLIKSPVTQLIEEEDAISYLERALNRRVFRDSPDYNRLMRKVNPNSLDKGVDEDGFVKYLTEQIIDEKEFFRQLKQFGIGKDLKYFSHREMNPMEPQKMPRYLISNQKANEGDLTYFQVLFDLLQEKEPDYDEKQMQLQVWELINQIATNEKVYTGLLKQSREQSTEQFWLNAFDDQNKYKKMYKQNIIYDLMEKEDIDEIRRVHWKSGYSIYKQIVTPKPMLNIPIQNASLDLKSEKQQWNLKFLDDAKGFKDIKQRFLDTDVLQLDKEKLNETAFWQTMIQNHFEQANLDHQELQRLNRHSMNLLHRSIKENNDDLPFYRNIDGKMAIENSLQIFRKASNQDNTIFVEFAEGQNDDDRELLQKGLFNPELRVRYAFRDNFKSLAEQFQGEDKKKALVFLMKHLHLYYFRKVNRQDQNTNEYFELFVSIIKQQEDRIQGSDEDLYENLEELLTQVRDQVREEQIKKSKMNAPETAKEELKAKAEAKEKEILCVNLIKFTELLVYASGDEGKTLVDRLELVKNYFQNYLFASHYSSQAQETSGTEANKEDTIQMTGSRAGDKKKSVFVSNLSKQAAFDLLIRFMGDDKKVLEDFISQNLHRLVVEHMPVPQKWGQQAFIQSNKYQKFVGLRNMGATCYMNSIMQQFFMIPSLRYNILAVKRQEEIEKFDQMTQEQKAEEEDKQQANDDDKLYIRTKQGGEIIVDRNLYQLQRLMSFLECSEKQVYDTEPFCYTYKQFNDDYKMVRTEFAQQKDSNEFLLNYCQTIEKELLGTSRKFLFEDTFMFDKCRQLICPNPACKKVKNKIERYTFLSLGIKNVESIQEALQKEIEGSTLDGTSKCTNCQEEVHMKKRELFASSPNVLIVHLQRITVNPTTHKNEKINSYVEFPNELDLKTYSFHEIVGKEGKDAKGQQLLKPDYQIKDEKKKFALMVDGDDKDDFENEMQPRDEDCWEYKLVGVNVHTGTANTGHYWSYINTNRSGERIDGDWNLTENWMEFNDTQVLDWDFKKQIESRCFGNKESSTFGQASQGTSAYMLFYERVKKKDIRIVIENDSGIDQSEIVKNLELREVEDIAKVDQEKTQLKKKLKEEFKIRLQKKLKKKDDENEEVIESAEAGDGLQINDNEDLQDDKNAENLEEDEEYKEKSDQLEKEFEKRRNQIYKRKKIKNKDVFIEDDKNKRVKKQFKYFKIPFVFEIKNDIISKEFFKQNSAYRQVIDDNKRTTFEIDAYSKEFLTFIPQLLEKVSAVPSNQTFNREQLIQTIDIGRKVGFEIMAKIQTNEWVGQVSQWMIKIMKNQQETFQAQCEENKNQRNKTNEHNDLAAYLIHSIVKEGAGGANKAVKSLFCECDDTVAQRKLTRMLCYAACHLKVTEKESDLVQSEDWNDDKKMQDKAGILYQFVRNMTQWLNSGLTMKHDNRKRFLSLFQLFYDIMVHDKETIHEVLEKEIEDRKKREAEEKERIEERKEAEKLTQDERIRRNQERQQQREALQKHLNEEENENDHRYGIKYAYYDKKEGEAFKRGIKMYDMLDSQAIGGPMIKQLTYFVKNWSSSKHSFYAYFSGIDLTFLQRTVCLILNQAIQDDNRKKHYASLCTSKNDLKIRLQKLITGTNIIIKMLDPDLGEKEDFTETLHFLSKKNPRVTKKVARNYLTQIKKVAFYQFTKDDRVKQYLENFAKFIKMEDKHDDEELDQKYDLKEWRLEWTLGFPFVLAETGESGHNESLLYGTFAMIMDRMSIKEEEKKEANNNQEEDKKQQPPKKKQKRKVVDVNTAYFGFKSSCVDPQAECYLGLVHQLCTTLNKMYLGALMLKTLCQLMIQDYKCREYIFRMPHPSLRFPTFMHSFQIMSIEMRQDQEIRLEKLQNEVQERLNVEKHELKMNISRAVMQICSEISELVNLHPEELTPQIDNRSEQDHKDALQEFWRAIDKRARNIKDLNQKRDGTLIKGIPRTLLASRKPYPYIMGGEIDNIDSLEEQMPTKDNEPLARIIFKQLPIKYLLSMPLHDGIMNAAFPEQVYRPPGKDNKDRLDYWDLCKDQKYNQIADFPAEEDKQLVRKVNTAGEGGNLDVSEVAAGAADQRDLGQDILDEPDHRSMRRHGMGLGMSMRMMGMHFDFDDMDEIGLFGFSAKKEPRNWIIEKDHITSQALSLWLELSNQEHSQVKVKITFNTFPFTYKEFNQTHTIQEDHINVNVPKTPIVAYTRGRDKQLIHVFTYKDMDTQNWVTDKYPAIKQKFNFRILIKSIKQTPGQPKQQYNRNAYNFEAEDEETAQRGRPKDNEDHGSKRQMMRMARMFGHF